MDSVSVELRNVSKEFVARGGGSWAGPRETVLAVDNLSLAVREGEMCTLLGPSGCGKTTTLRMVAGFEYPTRGEILLDGQVITGLPPNKRNTSMVFQSYALFPHMTVAANVAYGLQMRGLRGPEIRKRVDEMLELVGLTGMGGRAPGELSGGQQQRVALARALVVRPKVLLFDEPLSNLDAKLRGQMRSEIRRLQQSLSITGIYVTHDQEEAMSLSDRIVVMNAGRIEQIGTAHEVYARPRTRFVAEFMGKRTNFLDVMVTAVTGDVAEVDMLDRPVRVRLPGGGGLAPGRAIAVVRPELLNVRRSAGADERLGTGGPRAGESEAQAGQAWAPAGDRLVLEGHVAGATYLGSEIIYDLVADGHRLTAESRVRSEEDIAAPGEKVTVELAAGNVHLLPG